MGRYVSLEFERYWQVNECLTNLAITNSARRKLYEPTLTGLPIRPPYVS